uniref:Corticotropin-releasing factor domain-containing protein n=1 Tax=Tetranychus urticae TaxID=32264 RepID=T1KTX0_TETUR
MLKILLCVALFTKGINGRQTIDNFDSETVAFLDWFYLNELLPYFLVSNHQSNGVLTSSTSTTANKWLKPPFVSPSLSSSLPYTDVSLSDQQSFLNGYPVNHYHQHVNLPPYQLIANLMPHLISSPSVNVNSFGSNSWPKSVYTKTFEPNSSPSLVYIKQNPNVHKLPSGSRSSSRRYFGAPMTGRMTNDNFDKEKTIDETWAESINPLIKINVKIRDNIKALKDLEATYQKQPIPQRIASKLLLRALLNPLKK